MRINRTVLFTMINGIYRDSSREFHITDMSRSHKCHTLTRDLMFVLRAQGFPVRRELHVDDFGHWHYVIVHDDGIPRKEDIITDLNPWNFGAPENCSGPLHGDRAGVMDTLVREGAEPLSVALRGLPTIALPHTEALLPPQAMIKLF